MALVVDATVGGEDANSYVTLAEANTYFESKFYSSTWDALTDDEKNRLIVESTRMIDALYNFDGTITNTDPRQALDWPRDGAYDCEGIEVDSDIIPEEVKIAVYEQSTYLSQTNSSATTNNEYTKASVGKGAVSVEYKDGYTANQIATSVLDYLRCLGSPTSSARSGGISNTCLLRS